jgi:hypothetical protein
MATREEQNAMLRKVEPLTPAETATLTADAAQIRAQNMPEINRLRVLRMRDGLSPSEREEVEEIRHRIGPDIKHCANMERKAGVPVVSVR